MKNVGSKPDPIKWVRSASIGSIIVIFIVMSAAFGAFYRVPAGHVGIIFNQFGGGQGFDYNERPQGFGFKVPFKQKVYDLSFRTQTINFCAGEGCDYGRLTPKDKNGINFGVDLTMRYKIDPTQAAEFVEQKGYGIEAMQALMLTAARADSTRGVFGQYAQEDVPSNRMDIAANIKEVMQERIDAEASGKLKTGFITVEAVDVRNTEFNEKIEARIVEKQERLQEAQEMVYRLQTANATREKLLIEADAQKKAAILIAEGKAEAIVLEASAKAEGIDKINKAYQGMPNQYVLTKAFEAIGPNDKMYFGFDSLTGNQLSFLNMNELMAIQQGTNATR
jgi:regulator of protease activity HflC (stomatin/prohibitin superfamily)